MLALSKIRSFLLSLLPQSNARKSLCTCTHGYYLSRQQIYRNNLQIKSLSRVGNLSAARQLFDRMPGRDVVSWNSIITAHWHSSDVEESKKLFDSMPQRST